MTAAWPGSLPYQQFLGLVLTQMPAFIETEMDVGNPKARAIFSGPLEQVDCPIKLEGWQIDVFNAWRTTDLGNGPLPFTWTHPMTDAVVSFAFRAEPIKWTLDEGGLALGRRLWSATLPLRIIP